MTFWHVSFQECHQSFNSHWTYVVMLAPMAQSVCSMFNYLLDRRERERVRRYRCLGLFKFDFIFVFVINANWKVELRSYCNESSLKRSAIPEIIDYVLIICWHGNISSQKYKAYTQCLIPFYDSRRIEPPPNYEVLCPNTFVLFLHQFYFS